MKTILRQGGIITGSTTTTGDICIEGGTIIEVSSIIPTRADVEIDCSGKLIMPGMIDTHVHFRDPGFPAKGDAYTESKAAVSGGVTTVCDMPNTNPQTLTVELVKKKQALFASKCLANFGIYIGASQNNLEELKKADEEDTIPAIKIFMAESTGDMTLAEDKFLEPIFQNTKKLIATHAESELRRLERLEAFKNGMLEEAKDLQVDNPYLHSIIRDNLVAAEGTKHAVELALKYKHHTHILHISAEEELPYLKEGLAAGYVTGETCPHYLLFNREDIKTEKGYRIMNPALKQKKDNEALLQAIKDDLISQITTDHAPHLKEEKEQPYGKLPSGLPGVQFALPVLLHMAREGMLTVNQVVQLYAENPAKNYKIKNKGKLKAGYDADITIIDPTKTVTITNEMVISKCDWTPYAGMTLTGGIIEKTFVNGHLVFDNGAFHEEKKGTSIHISLS
jgi:dihydroorotase